MAHDRKSKVQEKMKEQPKNPEVEKKKNTTEEVRTKNRQCKNPEENTTVEVEKEKMKEKMAKIKQPNNAVEAEKTKNTTEGGKKKKKKKKKKQPNNPEVEKNENSTEGVKKKENEKMKRKRQPDDPEEIGNEKDTTEEVKNKEKEKKRKKQPNYSEVEESKSTTVEVKKEDEKNSSEGVEKNKNTTEEEKKKKKKKKKKQPKNPVEIPEQQQQQQEEIKTTIKDNNCESHSQVKTEQKQTVNNYKRKIKEVFPHGNYRSYYGYRIGQGSEEDPRLKAFKREWFEGKDCLDIGCNSGIVTIQIAKKFRCWTMLGIDIDPERISDARWNLKKVMRAECTGNPSTKAARLEATEKVNGSEHRTALSLEREKNARDSSPSEGRDLFDIVSFRQENFVESQRSTGKHYDTILCLSVTKWVHLNCGDDGLITLFSKIWELLHPGGILVLEPQPWKSYEKNRRVSETTAKNFPTITLYPESFQEILLDKIGFRGVEDITSGLSGTKTGFDRPIFAFRK